MKFLQLRYYLSKKTKGFFYVIFNLNYMLIRLTIKFTSPNKLFLRKLFVALSYYSPSDKLKAI